jgi:tRNA nucleotidyltransferase (CCA-adding enzyme)
MSSFQCSSKTANRKDAAAIIDTLITEGHEAYFVGGYVRDHYKGEAIKDFDIATSALPEQVMSIFPHCVATGLQHGTISVIIDRVAYEVTTFRTESDYVDARRPREVAFIPDLFRDLERRDFTMNAMAMDLSGAIIDPFDGRQDIAKRLIRAVGDANQRFFEDALRMLRCIRFAAHFDFEVEQQTWDAIQNHRERLQHISIERVRMELDKIMAGRNPARGFELLIQSGLAGYFKSGPQFSQALSNQLPAFALSLNSIDMPNLRWTQLFILLQLDEAMVQKAGRQLTHSNKNIEKWMSQLRLFRKIQISMTDSLLSAHEHEWLNGSEASIAFIKKWWKREILLFEREIVQDTMILFEVNWVFGRFVKHPHTPQVFIMTTMIEHWKEWLQQMQAVTIRDLVIDGHDLINIFSQPKGTWIKETLVHLLEAVAVEEVSNDRQDLLRFAQKLKGDL